MQFITILEPLRKPQLLPVTSGAAAALLVYLTAAILTGSGSITPTSLAGSLAVGLLVAAASFLLFRQGANPLATAGKRSCPPAGEGKSPHGMTGSRSVLPAPEAAPAATIQLERVGSIAADLAARCRTALEECQALDQETSTLAVSEEKARQTVSELDSFARELLQTIEEMTSRTDERASLSTEMSATTDAIAKSISDYSGAVLETSSSIEEMARSSKETAGNIEALGASTEQTYSSINEISATISSVHDTAQKTAAFSASVQQKAREGMAAMGATLKAMREIEKCSGESFDAINRLSVHSARIGDFVRVIQEVVEQTNLLSLNASIIAAQAGERGKAFAVVAEEVRQLAHRTSSSAGEINELVKNVQKETAAVQRSVVQGKDRVKDGVKISTMAGDALKKIEESAGETSQMVQKIAWATQEQAKASLMISEESEKNLGRLKQVTNAIREQERGTAGIVRTLENMRTLSQQVTSSTEEQARANRIYLQSVLEESEQIRKLRDHHRQKIASGQGIGDSLQETAQLVALASDRTERLEVAVAAACQLSSQLQAQFSDVSGDSAAA